MSFYLYTDGASKGNPGKSGGGAVIVDENMNEVASAHENFGISTNNIAEYRALLLGLRLCVEHNIPFEHLTVRLDSELIVKQLNGIYKVKHANLKPLYDQVKWYKYARIEHVYREDNKRADYLANVGVIS